MINVNEYIKETREVRQIHIDLDDQCIERGGNSTVHKGVLAQYLGTTIPSGRILLCHACSNAKCSNPNHLYWGTDKENIVIDGAKYGTHKNPWQRSVDKHGYEKACQLNGNGNKSLGGKANVGKPKSEEHKRKIAEAIKSKHQDGNYYINKPGRKKKE